jgi:hypothetical protein
LIGVLLFVLTAAVCLLAAVGVAAQLPFATSGHRREVGCVLVAIPLPSAVAVHLFLLRGGLIDEAWFVGGLMAFSVGAAFLLGGDEPGDDGPAPDDLEPYWWPDFERGFRAYERSTSSRRERINLR